MLIVADGSTFESIGSFHGKVGKTVLLEVHRGGSDRQMSVVPVDLEPNKMFLRGLESSARIIESKRRRARLHLPAALEYLLSQGAVKDADALIWDLRDGWGGAQPEYLDRVFNHFTGQSRAGRDSGGRFASRSSTPPWRPAWADADRGGAVFQLTLPAADENS